MLSARKNHYQTSLPEIPQRVAKVQVLEMFNFPKHFVLTNESDDFEDYVNIEEDNYEDESGFNQRTKLFKLPLIKLDDNYANSPDLDYMLPTEVRETLMSEGLSRDVVERSLKTAEKRHRLALHLTIQQQKSQKRADDIKRQSNRLTLPRISPDPNSSSCLSCLETTSGCDICHDVDARRQSRYLRVKPWQERPPSVALELDMSHKEEKEVTGNKHSDMVTFYQTEIEKTRWLSEQQLEKALVGTFFEPPRLVLVSSKIPKCQYIPKVLLDGEHVIYIVYDFDTWSFIDITDAIQKRLESIKSGCKAKSICLLCQGGPGYLYILRKFVITPQKLRKDSYKSVKEFWKALAGQVSKMTPLESKIHILGCRMGDTKQGAEVKSVLQKLVHPNMVYVEAPNDDTEQGKSAIGLYFNNKRYSVWKSHFDDSDDEEIDFEAEENAVDETESAPRSWSALAGEIESEDG